MKWGKRIFLFIMTNLAVMLTLSILASVLGVGRYVTAQGLDYSALAIFCLVWGMGGSLISLAISRIVAKWSTGVQLIDPNSRQVGEEERWLLETVHRMARKSGITTMPEVGIYDSPEVNAFATGPTQNRALVAVSSGLLRGMRRDEVEGVLAHEVAHIVNGDMVTMTLVQGIVNAFVMFVARIVGYAASTQVDEEKAPFVRFIVNIVAELALAPLGMIVVAWFSRQREFRADAGSARLGGREKMIAALERLKYSSEMVDTQNAALNTMKIAGKPGGFLAMFSTHPSLDDRIDALKRATYV